ncbi:MAG: YfiR family protein [Desulfobacterales bacterium]
MIAFKCRSCVPQSLFPLLFWVPIFLLSIFPHSESTASEYQQKAEFICDFAKFVRWPQDENRDSPLRICILGKNPFGNALRSLENRSVRGRPVSFRLCPDEQGADDCHIVFVSALEKERLVSVLSRFRSRPVLTVGEFPGFAAEGGIISLIRTGDQIRFEINTEAARRSGLQISSHLLKLARIVTAPSERNNPQ